MFTPGAFREVLDGRHVVYIGALDDRELHNIFIQSRETDGRISITTGDQGRRITDGGIRWRRSTVVTVIGGRRGGAIMKCCALSGR